MFLFYSSESLCKKVGQKYLLELVIVYFYSIFIFYVDIDIIHAIEKKIVQTARWLMIGMKDGRYPYSFDN